MVFSRYFGKYLLENVDGELICVVSPCLFDRGQSPVLSMIEW